MKSLYWRDSWNIFDFIIVCSAWFGTIASNIQSLNIGSSASIVKSLRIMRVFKIIKKYKNLKILFYTFIEAIP
jgi:hypothetical protein